MAENVRSRRRVPAKKPVVRIVLIGILLGILVSLACMAAIAFLMTIKTLQDPYIIFLTAAATALGAFVSGSVTTFLMGRNGLLYGLAGGFWMFVVLFIAGIVASFSAHLTIETLIQFLCCVLPGIVGGITTINLMPKKRRQTAARAASGQSR